MGFENIGTKESLPEKVVRIITESILSGEWSAGDMMPTEPELAEQFGVSRSVIRDAVRMLIAKGMIIVRHGKGTYVSESQNPAFSDAIILALRRENATAWDTEQFHALVFPEIFALAAQKANKKEKEEIQQAVEDYLTIMAENIHTDEESEETFRLLSEHYHKYMLKIIHASRNKVFILLGQTMLDIRQPRWVDTEENLDDKEKYREEEKLLEHISRDLRDLAASVQSGNPDLARKCFKRVFHFNKDLEEILKSTPVNEQPRIRPDHLRSE